MSSRPQMPIPETVSRRFHGSKSVPVHVLFAIVTAVLALLAAITPTSAASAQGVSSFVFEGRGWGHGVGMSQNGARNMATQGFDHVGILNHYYPNTVVLPGAALGDIRVHIGDATDVTMTSAGPISFGRGGTTINASQTGSIAVRAHDGGLQIGEVWSSASVSDPVIVSFPQQVKLENNGHSYLWGKLQLTNRNGKVRVVEVLPMEKYVAGISEMPAAWPMEALMAQAIAARTYAHEVTLHRRASSEWGNEYDISASTVDQNYIGYDAQDGQFDLIWVAAVNATAGHEIVDDNGPVRAYYSASNGGYTETAEYVFNNPVGYTVAGPDIYDEGGHPWTDWTRTYSVDQMSRWLNADDATAVGVLQQIEVGTGTGASARLDRAQVTVTGSNGSKVISGRKLMLTINAGVFGEGGGLSEHLPGTFTTIGNGVGAGLPQPSGIAAPSAIPVEADTSSVDGDDVDTPDQANEAEPGDAGYTPPAGWTPEPGTGVEPVASSLADDSANEDGADEDGADDSSAGEAKADDETEVDTDLADEAEPLTEPSSPRYVPPAGWTPEPGTGVAPINSSSDASAELDAAIEADGATDSDDEVSDDEVSDDEVSDEGASDEGASDDAEDVSDDVEDIRLDVATDTAVTLDPAFNASHPSTVAVIADGSVRVGIALPNSMAVRPGDQTEDVRERITSDGNATIVDLFTSFDLDAYLEMVAPRTVNGVCVVDADTTVCLPLGVYRALFPSSEREPAANVDS